MVWFGAGFSKTQVMWPSNSLKGQTLIINCGGIWHDCIIDLLSNLINQKALCKNYKHCITVEICHITAHECKQR